MARLFLLGLPLLALLFSNAWAGERGEDALRRDIEFARRKVYPALVNISVVIKNYAGGRARKLAGAGSGVIVSPAGHVLTNYHVAGDTIRILCTLPSREAIEARVIAHDPLTDISVLQLNMESREDPNIPVPFASLGDSDALRVGDYVLAMGNPMSLSSSMTLGIVSNPKRVFAGIAGMEEMELTEGQRTGLYTLWVQHDALLLPGNSGGPLVNLKGEVVGINELGGNGVGFAIPSNLVAHVLNQSLTYGEVRRGWIGLTLQPVNKLKRTTGALIASVVAGSPAEAAGVLPGDILLVLHGTPVVARFFEEIPLLYKRIADLPPGSETTLTVLRGGKNVALPVKIQRMEKYLGEEKEFQGLGLTIRKITGFMALSRKYPDALGVLITGVRPGYAADLAKPSLRVGDVIRTLEGKPVEDLKSFLAHFEGFSKEKKKKVLVAVRRRDQELLTVMDITKKKADKGGGEIPKAWIGIQTQVLTTSVSKALGLKGKKGFRVTQVFPDTEAKKAGLQPGDIIYAVNGSFLRASRIQDSEMLRRRVEDLTINTEATLSVFRKGKKVEVKIRLEETPTTAVEAKVAKWDNLEFGVRNITFMDRIRNKWDRNQKGVLVTGVTSGGWASLGGLRNRDLILQIGDVDIPDVKAFEGLVEKIEKQMPPMIKVFVKRGYRTAFVFIEPDWELGDKEGGK
ncbi:MAG: PDZ domain-containing protein [Planctomycetota bacterium]|jgi:serine protease Do